MARSSKTSTVTPSFISNTRITLEVKKLLGRTQLKEFKRLIAFLRRLNMNFWWLFKFRTFCAQLGEKTLALRTTGTRRENKHG